MSYDLTIWKSSATVSMTLAEQVLEAISDDTAHPSMLRFDAHAFVHDLQAEFGGEEQWSNDDVDPPFLFDIADFTGTPANWIGVNMGHSNVAAVLPNLVKIAGRHGLVIFDPQTEKLVQVDEAVVRFVPSEAEGLSKVTQVAVYPDHIEVQTDGRQVTFQFRNIARMQESRLARILKKLIGREPYPLVVGEREFCTDRRYVRFFCDPMLKLYTPPDPDDYAGTYIYRINAVLRKGRYATLDLS